MAIAEPSAETAATARDRSSPAFYSCAQPNKAVMLPKGEVTRPALLTRAVVDRGVRIPEGLLVGESPNLDAQRFRGIDESVCLITQSVIDS